MWFSRPKKSLQTTWPRALLSFFLPLLLLLGFRFFLFEPFIIPSGSMIPNLLIYDHIMVSKLAWGIKIPFQNRWLVRWAHPKAGDVVVFRYPKNPEVFFVKRLIAVPGDEIEVVAGELRVNGKAWSQEPLPEAKVDPVAAKSDPEARDSVFEYFSEKGPEGETHTVRFLSKADSTFPLTKVPKGFYFMMGDNRDQSSDSRYWGFVPDENLVGSPLFIWLSCEKTLPSSPFLCDPLTLRRARILKWVRAH